MNMNETKEKANVLEELESLEVTTKISKEEKQDIIRVCNESSDKKKIIKYLVDQYEQSQNYRIVAQNQARSLLQGYDEADREHYSFIEKGLKNAMAQEALNKKYIDIVTDTIPVCRWMKSICGIGPIISAYLYASFDPKVGKYNTDFLSYAGLNDNNNPWLGTEKAKEIVNDAVEYRQEKFDAISELLLNDTDAKQYKKIQSSLKKLGKNQDVLYEDIRQAILDAASIDIEDIEDMDLSIITDYAKWLATPKICDDILILYCATAVKRKPSNVRKGTFNNWTRKAAKTKAPTVDDLVSYLAKPPYNKDLKKRMFIIGDMFIRNSGREKSLYGRIYKQRKMNETMRNEAGEYAEQAARELSSKNWDKNTPTYKTLCEGKLSAGHINARARRYAVKLFISHVFEAMYYAEFGEEPPKTYVIEHMGHHDYIAPEVDYRPYIDGEL